MVFPSNSSYRVFVVLTGVGRELGHAIWTGCDASRATSDVDWILEEMQRGGDVRTYLKHITKG